MPCPRLRRPTLAGATDISDCRCPGSSRFDEDTETCLCGLNTYLSGSTCAACPTGTESSGGATSLTGCRCPELDFFLDTTAKVCKECEDGDVDANGVCRCDFDYYFDGSGCQMCPNNQGTPSTGECQTGGGGTAGLAPGASAGGQALAACFAAPVGTPQGRPL
jgi:hypothetical protein